MNKKPNKNKKLRPKIWKRNEILSLLKLLEAKCYRSGINVLNEEPTIWKTISATLKEDGIEASAEHCQRKWLLLYKAYTANPTQQSIFFKLIEQIVNTERNDAVSEGDDEEQTISNDEMECVASSGNAAERYETIEVVAESAPIEKDSTKTDGESEMGNSHVLEEILKIQRQTKNVIDEMLRMLLEINNLLK